MYSKQKTARLIMGNYYGYEKVFKDDVPLLYVIYELRPVIKIIFKLKGTNKKCNNTKSISSKKLYNLIIPIIENECKNISFNDNDIKTVTNNLEKSINAECHRLENQKQIQIERIDKLNNQIKKIYNDKLEGEITDSLFLEMKEQKENEIENCKKQICDLEKKIQAEKRKHTISYNQIKKLSEEFLSVNNITKPLLNKLIEKIEFDGNRGINLKLVFSNIKSN